MLTLDLVETGGLAGLLGGWLCNEADSILPVAEGVWFLTEGIGALVADSVGSLLTVETDGLELGPTASDVFVRGTGTGTSVAVGEGGVGCTTGTACVCI